MELRRTLSYILVFVTSVLCFYSCKKNDKSILLLAKNQYSDFLNNPLSDQLTLLADSNFVFISDLNNKENNKNNTVADKYYIKKDTVYFKKSLFCENECTKAIVKDNYVELFGKNVCYKIKLTKTELSNKITFDSQRFKDYTFFSYCQIRDSAIFRNGTPYELNNKELIQTDRLLKICMKENPQLRNRLTDNYFKQCIAVKNTKNEIVVWLNCICHQSRIFNGDDFQRELSLLVRHGGACLFKVKINLTKQTCYDLQINGDA